MEDQREIETMEAEYSVYAEEESKLNAEIGEREIITLPPRQFPTQHDSTPPIQAHKLHKFSAKALLFEKIHSWRSSMCIGRHIL